MLFLFVNTFKKISSGCPQVVQNRPLSALIGKGLILNKLLCLSQIGQQEERSRAGRNHNPNRINCGLQNVECAGKKLEPEIRGGGSEQHYYGNSECRRRKEERKMDFGTCLISN